MNIFNKLAGADFANPFVLGSPIGDAAAIDRRLTGLAQMTGGRGFRLYPYKPAKTITVNGVAKTRTERKAERVERANAAVREYHANLKAARERGIVGPSRYFSPDKIAKLIAEPVAAPTKVRKPRAKKVIGAVVD